MNNNINRITNKIAKTCKEYLSTQNNKENTLNKIYNLLSWRPLNKIRISEKAINVCINSNISPIDYFKLLPNLTKAANLIVDFSPSNDLIVEKMLNLHKLNPEAQIKDYRDILNEQYYDLITLEERYGTQSSKIEFIDLWLTPLDVIEKFFKITKLNKEDCLDPCAFDARWLGEKGLSIDILPIGENVVKKDFLKITKNDLPQNIKTIVGNLPFSLLDEFINKSLELVDDCYFLVNGDTIFKHFPNNIEHLYIFSGLEGNQKDNRSRCEFDVPFLIKSALWCCIAHITKNKQPRWEIETNLANEVRRDGYHIALGKNVFIKSDVPVDNNPRITKIPVTSSIVYKGGKRIINPDGTISDLKNFKLYKGENNG